MRTVIKTIGLLGGGVIGAAWAARCVLNGLDAVVFDTDPEAERKLSEVLENARRAYSKLSLAPIGSIGHLKVSTDIEAVVSGADFIQESLPEREEIKIPLLEAAAAAAPSEVLIASSTSGLLPSRLQSTLSHPQRFLVGHPFNPVYLMPLVEICGGQQTRAESLAQASTFYRSIGMHPLQLRKEVDAFIADRLMEALWREALWLVKDDIATVEEIDDAIRLGPGLRWSIMGTFMLYRIAGGEPGMRHFLQQFGPSLKWPWTKLMDVPELNEALIDKIVQQSDLQAADSSIRELERRRDDCLIAVMQALKANDIGAGKVLAAYEERLYQHSHQALMTDTDDLSQPLRLHQARVDPEWIDYNGHMTESRYLQVFGDASDALFRYVGIDASYHAAGLSYYTVETHIRNLKEVAAQEPLYTTTRVLAVDSKRLQVYHEIYGGTDDSLLASAEQMILHVDTKLGKTCPVRPEIKVRLEKIASAHASLPPSDGIGRRIGERFGGSER